jgi:hypothetical protein
MRVYKVRVFKVRGSGEENELQKKANGPHSM